jgi:DNA-binding MarR family transcriptional regulator
MDLVERNLNEENRRSIDLIISKKGIKLLEELLPEIEKQNALKGSLTDKEALQLSDLLDKIRV